MWLFSSPRKFTWLIYRTLMHLITTSLVKKKRKERESSRLWIYFDILQTWRAIVDLITSQFSLLDCARSSGILKVTVRRIFKRYIIHKWSSQDLRSKSGAQHPFKRSRNASPKELKSPSGLLSDIFRYERRPSILDSFVSIYLFIFFFLDCVNLLILLGVRLFLFVLRESIFSNSNKFISYKQKRERRKKKKKLM
jgi:hypothetical protein